MQNSRQRKFGALIIILFFQILIVLPSFLGQIQSRPSTSQHAHNSPSIGETPSAEPSPPPLTPIQTPAPTPGWQNFHQWGSLTLFNGLPSNSVRSIIQTPDGLMWFGTDSGLARFDGRRIQTIPLGDGRPIKILTLEVAPDATLWIGTDLGVYYYRNDQIGFVSEIGEQATSAISAGQTVVIATKDGQVFRNSADHEKTELIYERPDFGRAPAPAFTGIVQTPSATFISTYGAGLSKLEGDRLADVAHRPQYVNTLTSDRAGHILAGADSRHGGGFYSLADPARPRQIGINLGNLLSIRPDSDGGVWIGTEKDGVFRFVGDAEKEHFTFENTGGGLRSNTVFAMFLDREGVLWAGTNRGVCRYDRSSPFIRTLSDNANSNFVRTLYRARDGQILAGTNRGLFTFDGTEWARFTGFPAKTVYAIGEDTAGNTLIGGPGGVFDLSGESLAGGDVRAFANFRGKTYVAIFERGLQELSDPASMISGTIPTALHTADDRFWIGTVDGALYSFDGREITRINGLDKLAGAAIRKITSSDDGSLWIAGSNGIFLLANGELETVVVNYEARDLVADGADVWAATVNGGLLHIRRDASFGWIVSDLNVEQGLPSQQVFALLKRDNELLIGTSRGIVNYSPGTVQPRIVISRVLSRRLYEPEEWGRTINLDYPQNSLLLDVAGQSSRTFPEQFQYAFALKSGGGELIEMRLDHDSQYAPSNLAPGVYSIEARAINKDLLFSEPVMINFQVAKAPLPWTATALGTLLIIALIALIWAAIERRQIALRNRELAAARFDLANEAERERNRIARDLHDQTLADLRNLMLMSDGLSPHNSQFRKEIESVSTEIRRICEDLSPSVLENVGLVAALEFLLSRTVENQKFISTEQSEELVMFPLIVELHIYRIAQEILTNIKHHSDADLVEMRVEADDGQFLMTVRDNGRHFQPADSTVDGRGISNIRSRAQIIGAQISWAELPEGGNLFSLEISRRNSL